MRWGSSTWSRIKHIKGKTRACGIDLTSAENVERRCNVGALNSEVFRQKRWKDILTDGITKNHMTKKVTGKIIKGNMNFFFLMQNIKDALPDKEIETNSILAFKSKLKEKEIPGKGQEKGQCTSLAETQ